jgi:hypothetical protein
MVQERKIKYLGEDVDAVANRFQHQVLQRVGSILLVTVLEPEVHVIAMTVEQA